MMRLCCLSLSFKPEFDAGQLDNCVPSWMHLA
jgi:hypothetical protein